MSGKSPVAAPRRVPRRSAGRHRSPARAPPPRTRNRGFTDGWTARRIAGARQGDQAFYDEWRGEIWGPFPNGTCRHAWRPTGTPEVRWRQVVQRLYSQHGRSPFAALLLPLAAKGTPPFLHTEGYATEQARYLALRAVLCNNTAEVSSSSVPCEALFAWHSTTRNSTF